MNESWQTQGAGMAERPRRSLLYVPADRPDRVRKAAGLPVDCVIVDLEDGVDLTRKAEARQGAAEALASIDFGPREVFLRVNSPGSEFLAGDLAALYGFTRPPDVVMVPKVETPAQVEALAADLAAHGLACGLLPCVESARGLLAAADIARASDRNIGLNLGGFDMAADLGAEAAWEPLLFVRSQVVVAAAAAGIDAIDTPFGDLQDQAGLAEWSRRARALGFTGKCAIHPAQLDIINAAFSPTPEQVAQARRVVAAAAEQGYGAIRLDGKMVDMAVVKMARRTLAIAQRAGLG